MSQPSWTTAEHISWMFCPDPVSGALIGVDVLELVLAEDTVELSEAGALLEAAREGADEDSGVEVVGGGACCCVVVVG